MDFVPFTLFFVVCLLNFQTNVVGKPQSWPVKCRGWNYCDELVKPPGYPSHERLVQLYKDNKDKFQLDHINVTENRDSEGTNPCRQHRYMLDNIAMIIDEKKEIRYTLYIPGTWKIETGVTDCQNNANETLDQIYKDEGMVCVQETQKYPFVVLTHDMQDVESVNIMGLNSLCHFIQIRKTTVKY